MPSLLSQLGSLTLDLATDTVSALRARLSKADGPDDIDEDAVADTDPDSPDDDGPPGKGKKPAGDDGANDENKGLPISPLVASLGEPSYAQTQPTVRELAKKARADEIEGLDPKSLLFDPLAVVNALGYKDKPSPMTYSTLRAMSFRTPIVGAMIKTRITQVSNFATPAEDKFSLGFRIRQRDRKAKSTRASEQESQRLTKFVQRTANTTDEFAVNRDNFETFLKKITRDTLTYDQMTFEVVPARNGKPYGFQAVDASTIRIADSTKLFIPDADISTARFVQVYDGLTIATYTAQDLCFGVRNPTTLIGMQGYGIAELEQLITTVTALLWGMDYNMKFFSQGTSAKGILNIKGNIPEKALKAFRQHWYSMVAGVENAFKTPILNAEDAQWLNMQSSNRDMEYNAWIDFLIKVIAAIYDMDPTEINFKYGDTGAKSMFESSNAQKLSASKDKGLKPLLRFIANKLNGHVIYRLNEDFEIEFVGLDANTASEQADLVTKQVKTIKTIDECRAEEDLAPLPGGAGGIILDPTFISHLQAAAGQQQAKEQAALMAAQGGGFDFGDDADGKPGEDVVDNEADNPPGGQPPPKQLPPGGGAPPPPGGNANPFAKAQPQRLLAPAVPVRKVAPPPAKNIVIDVEV